ncbi:hypothetical protein EJ05DRAFT_480638 [Pseudovirgaria hyperparasitica]|uniref:SWI/SNF family DNA-dependent ATPase Ris1 n=1 Tax=Pseudovirgaria hyperparasitica TaxID=470096 RepID=A0A6A6VSJ3_9PEZI|nr:uncharacterized protein EJ05DRAFT_480638 [Pseudovirgaria hyperparasitica]KAF2753125.1 hypothetical protein EJ05DRAFT_480638 [Pseudovirgaria hyperparasitica]
MEYSTDISAIKSQLEIEQILLDSLDREAEDYDEDRINYEQNILTLERRLQELGYCAAEARDGSSPAAVTVDARDGHLGGRTAVMEDVQHARQGNHTPSRDSTNDQIHYPALNHTPQSSSSASLPDLALEPQLQRKRAHEHTLSSPLRAGPKFPRYTPSPSLSGRNTPHTGDAPGASLLENATQNASWPDFRGMGKAESQQNQRHHPIGQDHAFGDRSAAHPTELSLPSRLASQQPPLHSHNTQRPFLPPLPSPYNTPPMTVNGRNINTGYDTLASSNPASTRRGYSQLPPPSNLKFEPQTSSENKFAFGGQERSAPHASGQSTFIDLTGSSDEDEATITDVRAVNRPHFIAASQRQYGPADPFAADLERYYPPSHYAANPLSSANTTMSNYKQQMSGLGSLASNMYSTAQTLARGVGNAFGELTGYGAESSSRRSSRLPWEVGNDPLDRYDDRWNVTPQETKDQLHKLLENINADEDREETPVQLSIELKDHQKIGLAWLRKMEEGTNKGGILADDMGLGKTVQALALIIARPSPEKRYKTTLIVAPLALMRQWEKEIKTKVKPRHRLSVYIYHGPNRKQSFDYLRNFDCVLTTYGTLATERKRKEKWDKIWAENPTARIGNKDRFPLLDNSTKWYRVILDEAQNIKNKDALTSKAAGELKACTRICMTGTPMMNNVNELYSLIRFLGIKPYCFWNSFRQDIGGPITKWSGNNEPAMEKLRVLWKAIALRRRKDSQINGKPIIVIPPKVVESVHVQFDDDQKALYSALETQTQVKFNRYLKANKVLNNYANMLVLLLRLRQACCHPHLINDLGIEGPGNMTLDGMKTLAAQFADDVVARIKDQEDAFQCPVCFDATENPSLSFPCGHVLCLECFAKVTDPANVAQGDDGDTRPKCPSCRERLDANQVVDYRSFCSVHIPGKFPETGQTPDDESDSDDDETEDDDEEEDSLEDETLDGFIVRTDDEEEAEEAEEEDEDQVPGKQKAAKARHKGKAVSNGKGKAKLESSDTEPDSALDSAPGSSARRPKTKAILDEDDEVDEESKSKSLVPTNGQSSTTAAKTKGKGKRPAKRNPFAKKPPKKTLAQLKLDSRRSKAARLAYLKRLQKQWENSAKLEKTMELLRSIRENDPTEKTIIFSQWTSLLDLLEVPINKEGWGCQRYDGSMKPAERTEAIDEFTESPRCTILLTSLKAGNAGLNLHQASQVIMLDPFWNPYTEEQAIDRAHRFPQQRQVHVHRVLTTETVEDRIVALQDKKKMLIEAAMDETAGKNIARLGVREFGYLFGLNAL